jgi:hypothetical protein
LARLQAELLSARQEEAAAVADMAAKLEQQEASMQAREAEAQADRRVAEQVPICAALPLLGY